jgi:hypothetical protein
MIISVFVVSVTAENLKNSAIEFRTENTKHKQKQKGKAWQRTKGSNALEALLCRRIPIILMCNGQLIRVLFHVPGTLLRKNLFFAVLFLG